MILTSEDIKLLKRWGYVERDIPQIKKAIRRSSYELYDKTTHENKCITADDAAQVLGREQFLSGISRSAFHFTSAREMGNRVISFESSVLFK